MTACGASVPNIKSHHRPEVSGPASMVGESNRHRRRCRAESSSVSCDGVRQIRHDYCQHNIRHLHEQTSRGSSIMSSLTLTAIIVIASVTFVNCNNNNSSTTLEGPTTTSSRTTSKPIKSTSNKLNNSTALSLVIFGDDRPSREWQVGGANNTTINSSSSSSNLSSIQQLKRHSYNLTESTGRQQLEPSQSNRTSTDPLDTSDSYFSAQHRARFDDDSQSDDTQGSQAADDETAAADEYAGDSASSNLSEKKVVRELTKILSKGMSGATDQVRVETLENMKRRQRERKALKDNRARVFEEILSKAIESHPDNIRAIKKGVGGGGGKKSSHGAQRVRGSSSNLRNYPSPLPVADSPADVDAEMATDAETVLQHLQGLAQAIDGNSAGSPALSPSSSSSEAALSPTPMSELAESEDSSSSSSSSSGGAGESDGESLDEERPKKASAASTTSERPLVRQFKKIKNQLSQRRKQLDQIKKLFNIELALDPKNGSLIGKQVSSGGNKSPRKQQVDSDSHSDSYTPTTATDESAPPESAPTAAGRRTKTKGDKGRELLTYLRDNPEILASVMSELTVDADPSSARFQHLTGGGGGGGNFADSDTESPSPYHHSLSAAGAATPDYDEAPLASLRRKSQRQQARRQQHQLQLVDSDDIIWAKAPATVGRSRRRLQAGERRHKDLDALMASKQRNRNSIASRSSSSGWGAQQTFGSQASASSYSATQPPVKRRTAESMLLETLRERQLLNLARLDLVLAERASVGQNNSKTTSGETGVASQQQQQQQDYMESYRRSSYDPERRYDAAPGVGQPTQTGGGGLYSPPSSSSVSNYQQRLGGGRGTQGARPDDEVQHHFMMVNPTYAGNDTVGRQLNGNEYLSTFNSQVQADLRRTLPPYHQPPPPPPPPVSASYSHSPASGAGATGNYSSNVLAQPPPPPPNQAHLHSQQGDVNSLKRFRDWRDVSQSELDRASSPPASNISWHNHHHQHQQPAYDLSTGSTGGSGGPLGATMVAQSSKSTQFASYQRTAPSYVANSLSSAQVSRRPAAPESTSGIGAQPSAAVPGATAGLATPIKEGGADSANSLFMTRSSAAEPDASTVKLASSGTAHDNEQANNSVKLQNGEKQSRRANSDLKGPGVQDEEQEDSQPRRDTGDSDEQDGQQSAGAVDETADSSATGSGASSGAAPHAADYFSSYKDEIAAAARKRRRSRASNQHRQQQQQQQQRDLRSDMDSDDTGAMWAA